MSTGEDEPSSGLNGRLRPRKSNASPKTTTASHKLDAKSLNEKPKRTSIPAKASSSKPDDLPNKTDVSPVSQVLCSYCDKTFVSRQAVAKHTKRVHISTTKQDISFQCLFCNHAEIEPNDIIRHMIDSHPNQYFACLNCISRFSSTSELAEHKLNVCEKQKPHYRNKLRQKSPKKTKPHKIDGRHEFCHDDKDLSEDHGYNGIVISCELKPAHVHDEADIEDNITTNLILPPTKNLGNATVIEKNAVIVLDDLQWNKRLPPNFNFHTADADQILSRLGVVHRGPRTGEPNRRDWLKIIDETNQKFERCFDTSFYSKVASNVQENLAKFLDGSCNFNPDPDNTIKTRKSKNSVAINTAEGFPILLAFEQYSRNVFDGYMPRSIAPRHKWKWDNLEHDKTLLSPEQIKRDSHANNCIITLVSSLDIWTQLCMRQKFKDKFRGSPLEKKAEKQNIIGKELKEILEKRELPSPSFQVVKYVNPTVPKRDDLEFPASLGLAPATPNHDIKPAILSGEWVRPRCYICCACGSQARDSRALSSHITTQHPNAQIQHYEIVGERLLNSDISKHLYVPPSQVNNRTRPLRGYRECTKCKKSITLDDLHQHMLDCAGDTPTVRRKCRTARPFGVRKRRARLPDNTIRKKIRKDIRSRHRKNLIRPRQKNRSEVGDAETIRKMLADLPAKRHRVLVNPLNSNLRPRRKFDKQRNKLKIKKSASEDGNKKGQANVSPLLANVGNERLSKKLPNLKEGDSRIVKSNMNQVPNINRHNNTLKRKSPLNKKKNIRFKESKGSNNQGGEGRKCSDSGKNAGSNQSGCGNSNRSNTGEGSNNAQENGNRSNSDSNGSDNQRPGCSRENDNNRDSSGQPPNVPLKHSIARLTARSGTHDKAVQFHHLFLVQQECNNIPQHVPSRQIVLFENEAVVTKLDKPPLHFNHGGTMDPQTQKSKLNKPRKGLNDCIAMLRNKLVEPCSTSHKQVSIQCDVDELSTLGSTSNNDKLLNSTNPFIKKSKITHEIAVQCADLDSDESLAQTLIKQRLASQAKLTVDQKDKGKGKFSKGKVLEQKNEKLIKKSQKKTKGEIINSSDAVENKPIEQKSTLKEKSCVQESTFEEAIPTDDTKGCLENIKNGNDNIPITQSANLKTVNCEKEEINQIKQNINQVRKYESQSQIIDNSESEKMNSKTSGQQSIIEQSIPTDNTKDSLKNIETGLENIPINKTQSASLNTENREKEEIIPIKQNINQAKKYESKLPIINNSESEKMNSKTSSQQSTIEQFVPTDNNKGSLKNIKKRHENIPITKTLSASLYTENREKEEIKPIKQNINQAKKYESKLQIKINSESENMNSKTSSQQSTIEQFVPTDNNKGSLKNIKMRHENISITKTQSASLNTENCEKEEIKAIKQNINQAKKYESKLPIKNNSQSEKLNFKTSSQQSTIEQFVPTDNNKGSLKNIKMRHENISITKTQSASLNTENREKEEIKPIKQNINQAKKYESKLPIKNNSESEKMNFKTSSQQSTIEQFIPTDNNKGCLKNIKKRHENIPITKIQSANQNTENPEKEEIKPTKQNTNQAKKCESKFPIINNSESEKMNSKSSSLKEDINIIRIESENDSDLIHTKKQNDYDKEHVSVNHNVTETVDKTLVSYQQHEVINVENVNPKLNEDYGKVYNINPTLHDRSIQDVCQDVSINEHSEIESDIPPAHCNIHMESILTVPLDLSGKISSTQSDSPVPYPMSTYDDVYETLDLSNKNPNRDVTQNSAFIDEDVVDLRVKYASQIHYESDQSFSSIPDEATDLSLGNEQVPKDLSLKRKDCSFSRVSVMTNNEYVNIGSARSHYDSCGSNMYEENSCLDFSINENMQNNIPTDLSGRRDNRFQPLVSTLSVTDSRNRVESNEMHVSDIATNLSLNNRMDLHAPVNDLRIHSYESYELTDEITTHLDHQLVNPIIIAIDTENVSKEVFDTALNLLQHKTNIGSDYNNVIVSSAIEAVGTGITLITSKELTKDRFAPAITNLTTYMDMSKINHQPIYTKEIVSPYPCTKTPLCMSESITTSLPAYNLKNRTLVTPSSKYESTTPVYTLANACISVTKIDTPSSPSLTNMLLSIPGNTITNATSVYTLAGTTIATPINYMSGQSSLPVNNDTLQSFQSTKNITEPKISQNPEHLNKPISTSSKDEDKVQDIMEIGAESLETNVDQDPDIARKIALLPKELVEILGTMPLDHRKQLLNVLPQYVSTSTASSSSKNLDQNFQSKSLSPNSNTNKTKQTKLEVTLEKRHNLLNPTPPPSSLSLSSSELSPTSISSSILLTPPTPNFKGRQFLKTPRDHNSKILLDENTPISADSELPINNHSNIIDLTGDDNSQSMPEVEVHTTSEVNVQSCTSKVTDMSSVAPKSIISKTNNDKTASLRAVRIKTQSERQRSAFPEIKTRNCSIDIPVTTLHPDDKKIKMDSNNSLTIQQGEITSSQNSNRNMTVECEISSSVSINKENVTKENDHNKLAKKEVLLDQNTVPEKSYEVGSGIPGFSKKYDVSSTNVKNDDSEYTKAHWVSSAALSSPIQSETIISDNNNVVLISKNGDEQIKIQENNINHKQNKKTFDDDDSDDDVSLAAIVKQRNRDKKVDSSDSKKYGKSETNANFITSSVTTAEIIIDLSAEFMSPNDKSSEQSNLLVPKNTMDQSQDDKLNIETKDKNKKKGRKGRRNNNLNIAKINEQPTNDEFDINKENTVTPESENIKHKDDNIKQKPVEIDSGCVSSINHEKDPVCINIHYNEKIQDNKEPSSERNLIERDTFQDNLSPTVTLKIIDEANEQENVLLTYDQTLNKSGSHESTNNNLNRLDLINSQIRTLIPKKLDINTSESNGVLENSDSSCDIIEKLKPTNSAKSSHENEHIIITPETVTQEQSTVTPLRRSRRGKSLFIDSNVTCKEPILPPDVVSEHKMPLTKKQLIFSKLLLDDEHNVIPYNPSNIEKIINNGEINQAAQGHSKIELNSTIQNYVTNSEVDQQTPQSVIKTNKRKKSLHIKKKNKKKKMQQNYPLSTGAICINLPLSDDTSPKLMDVIEAPSTTAECLSGTNQEELTPNKSKEVDNTIKIDTISSQDPGFQKKSGYIEKRKPDLCTDIEFPMSSLPKKSKGNDNNINQNDVLSKKVLIKPDANPHNKAKGRTMTCYNKPVAARRARSKSVFVNSSDYYDPYDIDLEEMNEISESINQKVAIRKAAYAIKTPKCSIKSTLNKSEIDSKRLAECYEAVPSTSKSVTVNLIQPQKHEWLREVDQKELEATTTSDNKDTISDSDDSSKSDVPLKKYVEEKEKKMLDKNENLSKIKQVDINSDVKVNSKTRRKKVKRSFGLKIKTGDAKTQNSESEAQLRSEQFMESFGFFSERKPRKSNLLATKKISETLNKIANETDDVYFGLKERRAKKTADKRHIGEEKNKGTVLSKETKQDKKAGKRGRKKKNSTTLIECSHCQLCKKEFRRPDNYLRHQISLMHISKLLEIELNIKTPPTEEVPNYLIAYKLQFDKVIKLHHKIAKRQIHSLPTYDIVLPTFDEIVADAKRAIREQQIYCRGLSKDEALFLDCCELLKESHNRNVKKVVKVRNCNSFSCAQALGNQLEWFTRSINDISDNKSDGDVDSITARNILESEEVRNLENDLISGLQEAAKATKGNLNNFSFQNLREILSDDTIQLPSCSSVNTNNSQPENQDKPEESKIKPKRSPEYKEKMYPDIIENIDMFEDKFDKIKRKCRSQAAAASKQSQAVPASEASSSHKVRKSTRKGKKKIKNHQNTVMTKGALKGFDGIKVSIVTTDINMSAIMSPANKSSQKKKKNESNKKRARKSSEVNTKLNDSQHNEPPQKKLDVYEFMDTEDAEVFDFRPSTIMERFKSISNKEIPSTSKNIGKYNEAEISSDSASDGDDFVYMSDDYVCSDDETENSIMSCELKNVNEQKKSPHKRKDATEKNAVMGKIFKHNAVRCEKKNNKNKDIEKPRANLDQLFDSLLEEQAHSSKHVNETVTSMTSEFSSQRYFKTSSPKQSNKSDYHKYDTSHRDHEENNFYRMTVVSSNTSDESDVCTLSSDKLISSSKKRRSLTPPKMCNISPIKFTDEYNIKSTNDKPKESEASTQLSLKKYDKLSSKEQDTFSRRHNIATLPESVDELNSNDLPYSGHKSKGKSRDNAKIKSSLKTHDKERRVSFDCHSELLDVMNISDDAGVARQRVRRKCTVGKQNVLAETWSSESEPDGMPPRPNSAESVRVGVSRRRKGRKKDGHSSGNKKNNNKIVKRNDFESRVNSSSRNASSSEVYECNAGGSRGGFAKPGPSFTAHASTSSSSCVKTRPRPPPYYWSEGEDEQEHLQQHGWIVGDSHKKLVTMLAHAKGRKRNNDEKRHLVE